MKKNTKKSNLGELISSLILPALFVLAWIYALSGSMPPGAVGHEPKDLSYLRWLVFFGGYVLVVSFIMHFILAKKTAASIGWKTNGFQYELAFVSLGLGLGSFYALSHGVSALITISIPIMTFLFLAGLNHVKEIIAQKNYAPNNTLILIWDFGMSISLAILALSVTN
ncbi:MAG TPA: DUF6790 family protein [Candidatus Saccharimonadales bacterium]|nr:DUF6790 family protein [Candidatus Saccharimonadales bacterium]